MKNKEKKVIILDNISSPFIAQAIIILKEGAPEKDDGIIKEAERIVAGYFPQKKKSRTTKRQNLLAGGICLFAFLVLAVICIGLF